MENRHFVIESTDGPTLDGEFKLIAKDILKLSDGDRAQAPTLSNGFVVADITDTAKTLTLSPTGVGDEYDDTGYVAIGGNEIVFFGKESQTKLLVHGDGADASQSITDSSRYNHTITVSGNAQIDTAQSVFGGASILFDGTGDWLSIVDVTELAMGTGDWTVHFRLRRNASVTNRGLVDFRNTTGSTIAPTIYITLTTGTITYHTAGADRITGTTAMTNGTWFHVAVTKASGSTRLFINGTQEGSTYADGNNYIAQRLSIGVFGDLTTGPMNGHMDEIVIIKGQALWTSNFTPPASASVDTGSISGTDILVLTNRAQFNTEAASHESGDRVQEVLIYDGEDPADIISDLFQTYAGIPSAYIPLANWQAETAAFNGRVYSAQIAEPTDVNKLVSELIEQAGLAVWPDELNQQIRLQVLRTISTSADLYNEDNIITGSLEVREQPERRLSQVWVYFAKINPLVAEDQIDNYRSTALNIDATSEAEYGSPAIKKIFSRWIPAGGRTTAERVGDILLGRFKDPPRRFNFDLMRYAGQEPILGSGYQLGSWPFQDVTGAAITVPIQLTRVGPEADRFEVEAEEMVFADDLADPLERTIIIDSNINNVDLREMHDSLYAAPESGDTVNVIIQAGVIVGSTSVSEPALDAGTWPAGVTINVELDGRIQGKGGNGGNGGASQAGQAGGTALFTRQAINLTWTDGEIWGGGGGGGGSPPLEVGEGSENDDGYGGGGGAGQLPGSGGAGLNEGGPGSAGTTEAGGAGGAIIVTGAGGGPGLAGSNAGLGGGSGGAAGTAIDGVSFITDVGADGDGRGSQIN